MTKIEFNWNIKRLPKSRAFITNSSEKLAINKNTLLQKYLYMVVFVTCLLLEPIMHRSLCVKTYQRVCRAQWWWFSRSIYWASEQPTNIWLGCLVNLCCLKWWLSFLLKWMARSTLHPLFLRCALKWFEPRRDYYYSAQKCWLSHLNAMHFFSLFQSRSKGDDLYDLMILCCMVLLVKDTFRKIRKTEFIYICGSKMVPVAAQ